MEYALLQAVFLPLLLSPLAYIIGRKVGHTAATWFTFALFSIAIAAAEVAVGLALVIVAYRMYKNIDVSDFRSLKG